MSDKFTLPFLSQFDPAETAEGSLDPLGLYAISDALGVRLAPGVRERQSNPRFLTLALVGMAARAAGAVEELSKQGLPSWLVYEWVVVDALVSWAAESGDKSLAQGIPGRDKVMATLSAGDALALRNYLKTPNVFGFHGVYRVLGLKTDMFDVAGRISQTGFQILQAWERDQGLEGFVAGEGPGSAFRRALVAAVKKGLAEESSRLRQKDLKSWIRNHLAHDEVGTAERDALWNAFRADPLRREYIDLLVSNQAQSLWSQTNGNQAQIHAWMLEQPASSELAAILRAVRTTEVFFRLLTDAFDEIRQSMADYSLPVRMADVSEGAAVRLAAAQAPAALGDALTQLEQVDLALRRKAESSFNWASIARSPAEFAAELLSHHETVQRGKPPNGKRSWFDTFADGRRAIRQGYVLSEPFKPQPNNYVHAYRLAPLRAFASKLGRLNATHQNGEPS